MAQQNQLQVMDSADFDFLQRAKSSPLQSWWRTNIGDAVAPDCVLSWIPPVLAASISFKFTEATVTARPAGPAYLPRRPQLPLSPTRRRRRLHLDPNEIFAERSKWPSRISFKLWIQLILISFSGVTFFQSLFLMGIERTSPAIASAMPNLAPGLIFVIACTFRLEKVNLSCMYNQVKIVGTLLCVVGAVMMSLLHSTPAKSLKLSEAFFNEENIIGCLYLLAAVFVLSSNVVLQATTLGDFPAPISLCAITSIIGVFLTMIVELLQNHRFDTGWPNLGLRDIVLYSLMGGTVSGLCVSFNGWAMKKKGPVLVSMFDPIGTVISVILSVLTLEESISIGSLCGMCLMFTGLYFVLWAKGKEGFAVAEILEPENDVDKNLSG